MYSSQEKNVSTNWIIFRRIIITLKRNPAEGGAILLLHSIQQFIIALFFNIYFFWICTPGLYFVELESYVVRLIN